MYISARKLDILTEVLLSFIAPSYKSRNSTSNCVTKSPSYVSSNLFFLNYPTFHGIYSDKPKASLNKRKYGRWPVEAAILCDATEKNTQGNL